jgi:hypothetical protein
VLGVRGALQPREDN